jgi:hypothetical protein
MSSTLGFCLSGLFDLIRCSGLFHTSIYDLALAGINNVLCPRASTSNVRCKPHLAGTSSPPGRVWWNDEGTLPSQE